MNRFSPNQTLSNFATAVRETVDSVNKIFFAATFLLAAMTSSNLALAEPPAGARVDNTVGMQGSYAAETPEAEDAKLENAIKRVDQYCNKAGYTSNGVNQPFSQLKCDVARRRVGMGDDRACDRFTADISKYLDKVNDSCGSIDGSDVAKCVTKVSACNQAERDVNEYNEESESESTDYCDSALANKCPALPSFMNGRDYKADKKDAESARKDAKKELDDLMDDDRKNKADIAKQQLDIQKQQEASAKAFRDAQDELNKRMVDSLAGIDNDTKAAFKDAQSAANTMEVQYVKMRADARAVSDGITQAQDQLQVVCRGAAEKKYAAAESARLAAEKKGRKNLGTAISGSAKRTKTTILRQQAIDYQKYFTECTGGVSAEGVNAKNQIAAAQRAKDNSDKLMADQMALIEKQRSQMQASLAQMETDAKNKKSKVVEDIQTAFTKLTKDKASTDALNQQIIAQKANENLQANLSMQNKIAEANRTLMTTQGEASIAVKRMSCAGQSARRSETQQDKYTKAYGAAASDVRNLARACNAAKACSPLPDECTAATAINFSKKLNAKDRIPMKDGPTSK
ncbi:hypothetical protein BH10BDE1_BH10BDE1_29590 [soil metagenome]